jgi:hypothetical protein
MIWLVTSSPKLAHSGSPNAVSGWKLHAVAGDDTTTLSSLRSTAAACGLVPRHGWSMDLFIDGSEAGHYCKRCKRISARWTV